MCRWLVTVRHFLTAHRGPALAGLVLLLTAAFASLASPSPAAQGTEISLVASPRLQELAAEGTQPLQWSELTEILERTINIEYRGEVPARLQPVVLHYRDGQFIMFTRGDRLLEFEPRGASRPLGAGSLPYESPGWREAWAMTGARSLSGGLMIANEPSWSTPGQEWAPDADLARQAEIRDGIVIAATPENPERHEGISVRPVVVHFTAE